MSSFESPLAFHDGARARLDGRELTDNPYSQYYASHDAWKRGWYSIGDEHQIALELESRLRFMTERCKGLEKRLEETEHKEFHGYVA